MNKYLTILIILLLSSVSQAQIVGSAFNYQGQLIDNGVAANGQYDIIIDAFTDEIGNILLASFNANNVVVIDGIFTIPEVDFGTALLGNVTWLEISVKESINGINFETLSGRQRIHAAPYAYESEFANNALTASEANSLSPIGAITNDVLTFNGSQWLASAKSWQENNGMISTTNNNSNVGIGTTTPTALLVVDASNRQAVLGQELFTAVSSSGQSIFFIESSGSTHVGGYGGNIPNNSLYVKGETKQDLSSNGLMKFMARVDCNVNNGPIAPTNLKQSFNGVDNLQIEYVSPASGFGNCIVDFKHDISSRYWQVTTVGSNGDRVASCDLVPGNNNQLLCQQKLIVSGSQASGHMMILVY